MTPLTRVGRAGLLSGVAATVLISIGFFPIDEGGSTGPDGPIAVLVHEVTRSPNRILIGSMVGMVGALLLVWWAASVRSLFGQQNEVVGLVVFAFAIVMTAGALLHGSFRLSLTTIHDPHLLAEALRPLAALGEHVDDMMFMGAVGLAAVLCVASFRIRVLPKAVAVVGIVLAVVTLVLIPTDHGGVGAALLIWLVVACVLLAREHWSLAPTNS